MMTTDGNGNCRNADDVISRPGRTMALRGHGLCLLGLQFTRVLVLLRLNNDNGRAVGGGE